MTIGQYVVRIEIGWLLAIPHNRVFKFSDEESEKLALIKAAGLAIVQPYSRLWREEEDGTRLDLYKGDEWTDPAYPEIYRQIRDEAKNGHNNSNKKN